MEKNPPQSDWERQEFESVIAYKAFKVFLEMPTRDIETVASELSKSRDTIIKWAEKFDWERRADSFDFNKAQADKKYSEKEKRKMAAQQINLGRMLQAKGVKALEGKDLAEEPVAVILKAIELGIQIERSARKIERSRS